MLGWACGKGPAQLLHPELELFRSPDTMDPMKQIVSQG